MPKGILFVSLAMILANTGECLRTFVCISWQNTVPAIDVLTDSHFNNYVQLYAPWRPVSKVPCGSRFRSPLLDHWNSLNVTMLKLTAYNNFQQVLYNVELNMTGRNFTAWPALALSNRTYFEGPYGIDLMIAMLEDERNIHFGLLKGPRGTMIMTHASENGYFRIPDAEGFFNCIHYLDGAPVNFTTTFAISNQEECMYSCYKRLDTVAMLHKDDNSSEHVCYCYREMPLIIGDTLPAGACGVVCPGDPDQYCGSDTDFVVIDPEKAIDGGFWNIWQQYSWMSLTLPVSGTIEVNLTGEYLHDNGLVFLRSIEVIDEPWPRLKLRHSRLPCESVNLLSMDTVNFDFLLLNGTASFNLMTICMVLENTTAIDLPIDMNLTFSTSDVVLASTFVIEADYENEICQYKDVGVIDDDLPDTNINIWHEVSGDAISNINTDAGITVTAYQPPFPPPRIVMNKDVDTPVLVISNIFIKTTAPLLCLEHTPCNGAVTRQEIELGFQNETYHFFNVTASLLGNAQCTDKIAIEIVTHFIQSSQDFEFAFLIEGCASTSACTQIEELTGRTPGFPYKNIMVHSSHPELGPVAVKPCAESLYLSRATFAEPLIITVIVVTDDQRGSLPVNRIQVTGNIDGVTLQYTGNSSDNTYIPVPDGNVSRVNDVLTADLVSTDMYAVRIIDDSKAPVYNITDISIKACILTVDILSGLDVDDNRTCIETTTSTTSTSTTTTSTTTTTTSSSSTTTPTTTIPTPTTTTPTTTTTTPTTTTPTTTTTTPTTTIPTTTIPTPTTTTPTTTTTTPTTPAPVAATAAPTTSPVCCACVPVKPTISIQQAEEKAKEMAKELQVDVSTLSSTIRKKTSANDSRPSAKMVGSIGAVLLSVALGLVVVMDANYMYRIYRIIRRWWRLQQRLKASQPVSGHGTPGKAIESSIYIEPQNKKSE